MRTIFGYNMIARLLPQAPPESAQGALLGYHCCRQDMPLPTAQISLATQGAVGIARCLCLPHFFRDCARVPAEKIRCERTRFGRHALLPGGTVRARM
jgi:hypothetical protein